MISILNTPLCQLLGCSVPVVLAGMGGVARSELVAAVSAAGGFGFLGMVREPPDLIRSEIVRARAATSRNFGVNLIPAATPPELLEAQLDVVIAERIVAVTLFWDLRSDLVRRLRDAGCLVLCQIGSVREAEEAEVAGAHIVIAQGFEAGGHVRGTTNLAQLVPQVVARLNVPVLAAGGIVDGKGLALALEWGAQGVVIGTAFLATRESFAHDYHKRRIVEAEPGSTVHTDAFHLNWPRGAAVRVLPNSVTRGKYGDPHGGQRHVIGEERGRPIYRFSTDSPLRDMTGDFEAMALYAGVGAGQITSIPSAAERLNAIVGEASRILSGDDDDKQVINRTELSSPACLMHEASDRYMGYASKNELIAILNELIEAERAGARVTLHSSRGAPGPMAKLLRAIQRDEARWCALLVRHVKALGEQPSAKIGAFYDKAMTIPDLRERLVFLNRGQIWVVRKLREILPRVRDDGLHTDLAAMLRSHEANIILAEVWREPVADIDVCIKRIYEKFSRRDGYRILIDRTWPRGVTKEAALLDEWLPDIAPSAALRQWFAHDPERWHGFRDRYLAELREQRVLLQALRERAARQRVTLLYGARNKKLNHAAVLKECLEVVEQSDADVH